MSEKTGAKLSGSWTVDIGEQDEASALPPHFKFHPISPRLLQFVFAFSVHLWKYPGGYETLNKATEVYRTDPVRPETF